MRDSNIQGMCFQRLKLNNGLQYIYGQGEWFIDFSEKEFKYVLGFHIHLRVEQNYSDGQN